jgi:hypothetical protein
MTNYQIHGVGQDVHIGTSHSESTFESLTSSDLDRFDSDSDIVVLSNCELAAELVERAMSEFQDSPAEIGIIPTSTDLAFVWSELPSAIASLSMPLDQRCAVAIKPSVEISKSLRPVSCPVWDLVIRIALDDSTNVVALACDSTDQNLANAIAQPSVAPNRPSKDYEWLAGHLQGLELNRQLTGPATRLDKTEATALHAGLWQLHDYLDESHLLSQSIEGEGLGNGDYWHAIMHRREPDYSNGKYWFRRVGTHACFEAVGRLAHQILKSDGSAQAQSLAGRLGIPNDWDSFAFVDLCEQVNRTRDAELKSIAENIQWAEMLNLLVHCFHKAVA